MWNLSMRDPLPRNNSKGYNAGHGFYVARGGSSNRNTSSNPMQVRRNKSNYCWNFNKGLPCKFGAKCKFIERCKYCDSPTHGVHACQKLLRKEAGNRGNNSLSTGSNNTTTTTSSQPNN